MGPDGWWWWNIIFFLVVPSLKKRFTTICAYICLYVSVQIHYLNSKISVDLKSLEPKCVSGYSEQL